MYEPGSCSGGLGPIAFHSPRTSRLKLPIGSNGSAASSFNVRERPRDWLLRMVELTRWKTSPSAMPPKLVMNQSFNDGRYVSPKFSHDHDPKNASGTDSK